MLLLSFIREIYDFSKEMQWAFMPCNMMHMHARKSFVTTKCEAIDLTAEEKKKFFFVNFYLGKTFQFAVQTSICMIICILRNWYANTGKFSIWILNFLFEQIFLIHLRKIWYEFERYLMKLCCAIIIPYIRFQTHMQRNFFV